MARYTRRRFLSQSVTLALGSCVAAKVPAASAAARGAEFRSGWPRCPDRVWLGSEYWANPMQDWRVASGRVECTNPAGDRNVHLLVRELASTAGTIDVRVRLGRVAAKSLAGPGSAGFRIGIQGPLSDSRNRLISGRGLDAGVTGKGSLFIGDPAGAGAKTINLDTESMELRLSAAPDGAEYTMTLVAFGADENELGRVTQRVPAARLTGNIALVNNFGASAPGGGGGGGKKGKAAAGQPGGKFWFADWSAGGTKVTAHPERAFGPILFSQYTLSGGVMKLAAQMPPLGAADTPTVRLQVQRGAGWTDVGEERIHADARTATFRVERWDDRKDTPYRVAYTLKFTDGATEEHHWTGTIRRDPADQPVIAVADVSCNIHEAFPNAPYVERVGRMNPDLLAFTGDQFYESSGGYGIIRDPVPLAQLDYLRKWYLHGWTWREVMRDRPSLSLPDDHDVYQGNLWGQSGEGRKTTQAAGGYDMPVDWVNTVYRSQTSHHPDPHERTAGTRGTIQYYGSMLYGGISFAILADRQYKSGPEGKVPNKGERGDHVTDPNFDPKTADVSGLSLLGPKQEKFLSDWVRDWRGAEMKAVISQTLFSALPTTHGRERMILRADFDTNGWPQAARNRALREMRKAFAFHIAGDQHIPAVVQYGVDEHRDGPVAFAGPAVNVGYPRWFEPDQAPWTQPKQPGVTGDFTDSFGHPVSVMAVRNGAKAPRSGDLMRFLDEKASGLGIVRFDKPNRRIVIECWPFVLDASAPDRQMPGWPVTVDMTTNYSRRATAHLPILEINGLKDPVVEVIEEKTGELVYALRIRGQRFQPHVFAPGKYTVKISAGDGRRATELKGLDGTSGNRAVREVRV
ncbi:MAG: alkaline phosphatase D family protein [Opitutaceae bacterium]|nr:alkaline phosphatase D family protein [Opitutaceae bacterium]